MAGMPSIISGPQKALLVLHYTPVNSTAGSLGEGSRTSAFKSLLTSTKEQLEADNLRYGDVLPEGQVKDAGRGDFVMEVQYNPSSISMTANTDNMPIKPLQPAFDPNVPLSASVPPSVVMMIELIFDDIVVPDAFMYDKLNVSVGNLANDALLLKDAALGKVHSVQPQTNGLLAAMQRLQTRALTLYWSDLHFNGEIKDIQAKYTLFSVSGRPIRSVVNMTLVQTIGEGPASINQYWNDAINDTFKAPNFVHNARTAQQKMGALLNVNF